MAILRIGQTVRAINCVSATGAGSTYTLTAVEDSKKPTAFRWNVGVSNTPYSAFSVNLEISSNGSTWTVIDTQTATGTDRVVANAQGFGYVRANVVSLTGGASDSKISVSITGLEDVDAKSAGTGTTTSSAAPGTLRDIVGKITGSGTMTSGNLVGVRGECNVTGAVNGQAYMYGAQGKLIVPGTMTSGGWCFGVAGQLDISSATLTDGAHLAPIWGDAGTSGPSATKSFCNLLVLTNTTATTFGSHIYSYGKASVWADISANGSACLDASTTASGSVIGHIKVTIDGVAGVIRVYDGS